LGYRVFGDDSVLGDDCGFGTLSEDDGSGASSVGLGHGSNLFKEGRRGGREGGGALA
jgi:hypothetical protein